MFLFGVFTLFAQVTTVSGVVLDAKTKKPVAYAGVSFPGTGVGTQADFEGNFTLSINKKTDKFKALRYGYNDTIISIVPGESQTVTIYLYREIFVMDVVQVRDRGNPAEMLLDSVKKYRYKNDMRRRFESYQCEAYIKNVFKLYDVSENFLNNPIIKQFDFFFSNPDTIKNELYYPLLITETISEIYKEKGQPAIEVIKADTISGFKNQSLAKLTGATYNQFKIYKNSQLVLGRTIIGPLAPVSDSYYKFELEDTLFIDNQWCFKIHVTPRLPTELTYAGYIWIHDSTYAIKRVDFHMNPYANVNYVGAFELYQEYERLGDTAWVLSKENARLDFDPGDIVSFSMNIVQKNNNPLIAIFRTASYKNYRFNQPPGPVFPSIGANITVLDYNAKTDSFWQQNRHIPLTNSDSLLYLKVDSLKENSFFKFLYKVGDLIGSGYLVFNYFQIGPIYEIYSFNEIEGSRIKFGGRSGDSLSQRFYFAAHGAYGFRDERWKWDGEFWFHVNKNKNPWRMLGARARFDLEQLGLSNNQFRPDNLIGSFFRRRSLTDLSYLYEGKVYYSHDWFTGLNQRLEVSWRKVYDTGTLRFALLEDNGNISKYLESYTTSEISLETTFEYGVSYIQGRVKRRRIRGKYPQVRLKYTLGLKDVLGSDFNYHKIQFSIQDRVRIIQVLGYTDYRLTVGKIFGKVPYTLMRIHTGNDTYVYDKYAFNLMNYFEFVSDQYIELRIEHFFNGLILNKIPGIRRFKWRLVVGARAVIGSINDANERFFALPEGTRELVHPITGKPHPYVEMNVGIDNIFNFLRVDFLWRLTHRKQPNPKAAGSFIYPNSVNFGVRVGLSLNL